MLKHNLGFSLVALLLVSFALFPTTQQAFADVNLIIANGDTYTVFDGETLSITGILTVQSGGKLIVEDGGTINIDGIIPNNGINNLGEIEQSGTIEYLNPSAVLLINFGSWIVNCSGTLEINGLAPLGDSIIFEEECGEIILDIPGGVIPFGTVVTVDDEGGKTVVLENDLIISGTLINSGFLSNRALITLDDGLIDLSSGGTLQNVCNNFPSRGIDLIGNGQINEGTRVNLPCNPPIATVDSYSVSEDTILQVDSVSGVLSNDTPGENDDIPGNDPTLSSSILTDVSHGSIALNSDGSFDYTPDPNFSGSDSFTYTLSDGNGGSATASVNITVSNVNDSPTANDDSATTAEDTPIDIPVLNNDVDPDGDDPIVTSATPGTNGITSTDGTTVTYIPNLNYFGDDSFTYTISDGNGGSDSATVNVTVTPLNDPPIAIADVAPNPADEGVTVTLDGTDSEGTDGTITDYLWIQTDGTSVQLSDNTSVSPTFEAPLVGPAGELLTFSLVVTDDNSLSSDPAEIIIQINNLNSPPIANDDSATITEDTPIDILVLGNDEDPDGDDPSLESATQGTNGTTSTDGTTVTYIPNLNYFGDDSFTYTISDDSGEESTATVNVTVTPVNDAPICSDAASSISIISQTNHKMVPFDYTMTTSDVDNDEITLSILSVFQDEPTTSNGNGDKSPDADLENSELRAERNGGEDGRVYVITVQADDGNGGTCTDSFSIGVPHDDKSTPVNSGATYNSTEE